MVYTLGPEAALQLALEDEFNEYAKTINLRNPYAIDIDSIKDKMKYYLDGSIGLEIDFDKKIEKETLIKEKKVYSLIKYAYILERIFEEMGYEAAKNRVILWGEPAIAEYFKTFCPCEGATGQCSIECPKYLNCKFS